MKFPYRRDGNFDRPLLPVFLKHRSTEVPYQVLVDTGADHSVAHIELAHELGIPMPKGSLVEVIGVAGTTPGFITKIAVQIGRTTFQKVPVIFADLGPRSFGILGHAGLFDRLRLTFSFAEREFSITPRQYRSR